MNSSYEKKLGENLKKIRLRKKLSQEKLSLLLQLNRCDLTKSAIAKIEVGQRHMYPDEIKALKEALNISYEDFFI